MPKFSKQMIELQAWQDFELEYLVEPEPELDPHYAGIIQGEGYTPTKEDDDWYMEMLDDDPLDYIGNINDFDYEDFCDIYDD